MEMFFNYICSYHDLVYKRFKCSKFWILNTPAYCVVKLLFRAMIYLKLFGLIYGWNKLAFGELAFEYGKLLALCSNMDPEAVNSYNGFRKDLTVSILTDYTKTKLASVHYILKLDRGKYESLDMYSKCANDDYFTTMTIKYTNGNINYFNYNEYDSVCRGVEKEFRNLFFEGTMWLMDTCITIYEKCLE